VAVKIKLKRLGKIRAPYYRIVVADSRTKRDGRAIEEIGKYHPKEEPSFIEVDSERAQHWLSVGAQPTDPVRKIFEVTGDWQKFKGLPGAEGTLRVAEPKADRKVAFAAALQENLADSGATTPKGKTRSAAARPAKAEKAEADKPSADKASADKASADKPGADKASADKPGADKASADKASADKPGADKASADKPARDKAEKPETAKAETAAKAEKAGQPAKAEAADAGADTASSEG
jgi:small subunit ribosomal protein S16